MQPEGRTPTTPGRMLQSILDDTKTSVPLFSSVSGLPESTVTDILNGAHRVSRSDAVLLGCALGMSPEFWTNLQASAR